MELSRPFQSLLPAVDSAVLAVLAGSTKPRTGREVARMAGRSQPATQRVLDRLVEHGLVDCQEAGRSRVYVLNRDHLAAPAIEQLASLRTALFDRLREAIKEWEVAPRHASVFGSAARGDGTTDSDVDIFLVRPRGVPEEDPVWREQVEKLANDVRDWTGNHVGMAEVDEEEVSRLKEEQPPVVADLRTDAVELAGTRLRQLLGGDA